MSIPKIVRRFQAVRRTKEAECIAERSAELLGYRNRIEKIVDLIKKRFEHEMVIAMKRLPTTDNPRVCKSKGYDDKVLDCDFHNCYPGVKVRWSQKDRSYLLRILDLHEPFQSVILYNLQDNFSIDHSVPKFTHKTGERLKELNEKRREMEEKLRQKLQ